MSADVMPPDAPERPTDDELAALIKPLWRETKPSAEAQRIRAAISTAFDDARLPQWASDFVPDYVWDLVDIAAERGIRADLAAGERERLREAVLRGDAQRIGFYEREFYPLSNFSAFTLHWRGIRFDTSEAAYHWEKFPGHPEIRNEIARARSAHAAFKLAEQQRSFRRADWDAVKVGIMRDILQAKVEQHEYVQRKLIETGDRELVEDSWRDDFWGIGPNGDGQNMLGKLWMELRAALGGGS